MKKCRRLVLVIVGIFWATPLWAQYQWDQCPDMPKYFYNTNAFVPEEQRDQHETWGYLVPVGKKTNVGKIDLDKTLQNLIGKYEYSHSHHIYCKTEKVKGTACYFLREGKYNLYSNMTERDRQVPPYLEDWQSLDPVRDYVMMPNASFNLIRIHQTAADWYGILRDKGIVERTVCSKGKRFDYILRRMQDWAVEDKSVFYNYLIYYIKTSHIRVERGDEQSF